MNTKKLSSYFLIIIIIMSTFLQTSNIVLADSLEGDGTVASPYLIKSVADLDQISNNTKANYKLINDLDLKDINRAPITLFEGVFDGDNHVIKNLNIVSEDYTGLFGKVTNATIKNITINGANVSGRDYSGVIAGYATSSNFTNCTLTNITLTGSRYRVGAISGLTTGTETQKTKLSNCYVTRANITGGSQVAGLIGSVTDTEVYQCYSIANIKSDSSEIGGLVGRAFRTKIEQCFTGGTIEGRASVAGIMALALSNGSSTIINCYSQNKIISTYPNSVNAGIGVASDNNGNTSLKITNSYAASGMSGTNMYGIQKYYLNKTLNCYFDHEIAPLAISDTEARTTNEMYQKSNYNNWDFETVWMIDEGNDYPRLRFAPDVDLSNPEQPEKPEDTMLKVVLKPSEVLQLSVDIDLTENLLLSWKSSDTSVADVDQNGVVSAHEIGDSVITVSSDDGTYTDYINILVVDDVSEYRLAVDLKVGEKCKITMDNNKDVIPLTWSSMDPTVSIVTQKGTVKAMDKGLALIIGTDDQGNHLGQVYIRVR